MAGFEELFYETDVAGLKCLIRYSAAEASVVDSAPSPATKEFHVLNRQSGTRFGIYPRGIRLKRTVTQGSTTAVVRGFLAIPTTAQFDGFAQNETITINQISWTIVSKKNEHYR